MTRRIVAWSLSYRLLVIPIAAALLVFGVIQLRDTPVDVLPEFTPTYVEIQTEALGLSAPEVEQLITVPLERDLLNGVAGVDVIRSESVLGLSSITLVFDPGTDLLSARQLVQERLIQAHILPNVAKPPVMLQPLSSQSRVMMIGLSSKRLSLTEIGLLARWTIRPRLMSVPGVANVVIWGQREHQLQVQVDPRRLREHGVSLQQIVSTAGNAQLVSPLSFLEASTPGTGGFIDTPNQRLQVRHILPIAKASGLSQVVLDGGNGERRRLGDVADVVEHHQPLIGDAVVNDGPGLILVVEKFPGANTLEVSRGVDEALEAMRPGLSGIEIDSDVFRPANFIEEALDNLALALLISSVLLAFVLVVLLRNWRTALISLISIPLALVTAGLVLSLRGETLNALVFVGLAAAIGVVVDDSVVGVENAWRRRESGRSIARTVLEASLEARGLIGYATLIALLPVVPILFLSGRAGAFFEPLVISYAIAVLASILVALTVIPALTLLLFSNARSERQSSSFPATARYTAALSGFLARARPALAIAGVIGLAALALVPLLDQSLVPAFKERQLQIHLAGAPGTSRPEMVRIVARASRELRSVPGVRNVGAHVGRAVMGDLVGGVNSGSLWLTVDPEADYDATVGRIDDVVQGYPGLDRDLVTYSSERVRAVGAIEAGRDSGEDPSGDELAALTGAREPVVVRIYGKELDVLRRKASEVRELLLDVDGVVSPRVERQVDEPTLEIEPNLVSARRHGIKPGDIRRASATLVQGIEVGSLFEEQKVFDVIVTGVPETRHSPSSVRELLIDKPNGGQVRLSDVADVRIAATPSVIRREATSRRIDVAAGVRGRGLESVLADIESRLKEVSFPLEYHAEVRSESSERKAAGRRALGFAIAGAIAILLLLQAAFGSWRLAILFFAALPIVFVGGVAAAFVLDDGLSVGVLAGLLLVFGLAVRNGLSLISRYQGLQRKGEELSLDLVRRGAQEKLAPILMTALATALALVPFLVLGDVPGHEIAYPMAVVALGGLITSILFALFVVPALYLLFAPGAPPDVEAGLT